METLNIIFYSKGNRLVEFTNYRFPLFQTNNYFASSEIEFRDIIEKEDIHICVISSEANIQESLNLIYLIKSSGSYIENLLFLKEKEDNSSFLYGIGNIEILYNHKEANSALELVITKYLQENDKRVREYENALKGIIPNHFKSNKLKILTVDDEQLIANEIKDLMIDEFKDSIVEEAYDGEEALEKTTSNYYDLIISDIRMPRMNGVDFFINLRLGGYINEFLFVTGHIEHINQECLNLERCHVIEKPFSFVDLIDKAKDCLEISSLQKRLFYKVYEKAYNEKISFNQFSQEIIQAKRLIWSKRSRVFVKDSLLKAS